MRSTVRRTGLPLLLAIAAVATLPVTSLGGDPLALAAGAARSQASPAANPVSYGSDGRLTLLLLGSDWRIDLYGERMDVVMVVTIDPVTHRVSTASIPRDMVFIPRAASNGGGTSGTNRINAMYSIFYRKAGLRHTKVDLSALVKFKADVATLLATEIDYVAMIRFGDFTHLLDAIGGVDVSIPKAIKDTFYQAPGEHNGVRGVYFPVSSSWHLAGKVHCQPYPKKCHNGLAYARSRHGFVGTGYNSDFQRARRQQFLVQDGANKIVSLKSSNLPSLLSSANGYIYTNLPRTLDAATQLYNLAAGSHLAAKDTVVFSPSKWAKDDASTPIYTFRPKLGAIRGWINDHFGS